MNKKIALVTLIETSMLLTSDEKLALIDAVPMYNDKQVDALGKFLATGRQVALANEDSIMKYIQRELETRLPNESDDAVYVGTGRPS